MRQTYTSEKRLLPEGKGRGAVKLAPLRRRSRGEQSRISQASKAWGLRGLSLGSSRAEPTWCPRLSGLSSSETDMCCSAYLFRCYSDPALLLSHDGARHQAFRMPVPSSFEAACSQGRTAPEVTLRGTMRSLRALARKPQESNAQPMPFRLGKHFEVAILVRVYQGHHGHTAQCRPGGGEALRLERIEARGEAKVRQELAL